LDIAVVVVPTYNEEENIEHLIGRFRKVKDNISQTELHILFVDDSSQDGTALRITKIAERDESVHLLTRSAKFGLGTAYRDGFAYALERFGPTMFVQMDADLQHPPEKIPDLLQPLREAADVTIASRYVEGGGSKGWSRARIIVSKGANWFARTILHLNVRDVTSGFRGLNISAVAELLESRLTSTGFAFQVESIQLYKRKGLRIREVPFVFQARAAGKSKLSWTEILRFAKAVIALRFK
jgi:dolichol-phosphate mannosyltransferase